MRTLVATALINAKGNEVYCTARKVTNENIKRIRNNSRQQLESIGFTFVNLISLDYPNVKGYAVFYEGHLDDMEKSLKLLP